MVPLSMTLSDNLPRWLRWLRLQCTPAGTVYQRG